VSTPSCRRRSQIQRTAFRLYPPWYDLPVWIWCSGWVAGDAWFGVRKATLPHPPCALTGVDRGAYRCRYVTLVTPDLRSFLAPPPSLSATKARTLSRSTSRSISIERVVSPLAYTRRRNATLMNLKNSRFAYIHSSPSCVKRGEARNCAINFQKIGNSGTKGIDIVQGGVFHGS